VKQGEEQTAADDVAQQARFCPFPRQKEPRYQSGDFFVSRVSRRRPMPPLCKAAVKAVKTLTAGLALKFTPYDILKPNRRVPARRRLRWRWLQ